MGAIDRIIRWSLENRLLVLVMSTVLLATGAYRALRMPVDVFPDLTAPTVTVIVEAHGLAPQEVETQVAFPIETALNGAAGVRRVRSSSAVGIAIVWVEFGWGTEIYRARQIVAEKLQLAQATLPPEVDRPVLAPVSSIMGEIMFIALTSSTHSPMELRTTADWMLRRRLLAVPGVSQVVPIGGEVKQYQVVLRPERLLAHAVTVDEVMGALRASNVNSAAGFRVEGGQEYLIRGVGRVHSLDDIESTVVALRGGLPVLVRQLGTVRLGPAPRRGTGAHDGRPAVILGIQKQPEANTLELTRHIDRLLDDVQRSLPAGMKVQRHIFRQADFIARAVHNIQAALRDGALLVVAVVLVFLVSGRATLITLLALPLSLVASVLVLWALGATLNTMTLGGMAIAVGALVDDAIIDVENVVRRLRQNLRQPEAEQRPVVDVVFEASREVRSSILYASLVIVLVFLPVFFLAGVEGRLLQPLGLAYVVALGASLLVALTVTPALCSLLLPRSRAVNRDREPWLVRRLVPLYGRLLDGWLGRWKLVGTLSLLVLGASVVALVLAGRAFLPEFNEGSLTVNLVTPPGTSLAQSDALGRWVEQILLRQPEVTATARRTGRAELDEHAQDVSASEIDVGLKPGGGRRKAALLAGLRRELAAVPGSAISLGQPISHRIDHMLSGTRSNLAVKVFGPDLQELRRLAEEVRRAMQSIPGVADLAVEPQVSIPFVTVRFDRLALARHGLKVRDAAEAIETAFQGQPVSRVLEPQAAFDLVVRFPEGQADDMEALRATLIGTPRGAFVPLSALARIRKDRGPNTINRENVQRRITVTCNAAGRDLGSLVDEVRRRVTTAVAVPGGYRIEYGGQFESATEASRRLLLLGGLVALGIFALLFGALGSVRQTVLVMLNLPLALIGGVAGVYLGGGVLSVASMVGFITLFGIATRNGLMLVAHAQHLGETEGLDTRAAIHRGACERLVPILMTALAAGLALVPLALAGGEPGNEIQSPMALVILCGLLSSTALNMFVVPAFYLRFGTGPRPR
jgi:CzcA family heavy metal efflux pump